MSKKLNLVKHSEFLEAKKQTLTVPFLAFSPDNIVLPDTGDLTVSVNQLSEEAKNSVKLSMDEYNSWLLLAYYKPIADTSIGKTVEKTAILAKIEMNKENTKVILKPKFKYEILSQNKNTITGAVIDDLPTMDEKEELDSLSKECSELLMRIIGLDEYEDGVNLEYIQETMKMNSDPSIIFSMCLSFTEFTTEQITKLFLEKKLQKKFKLLIELFQSELNMISAKSKEKERIDFYKNLKTRADADHQQAILKEMRAEIDKKLEPDSENIADSYEKKLELLEIAEESKTILRKEIKRLKTMNSASAEYHVIENYLSTVFSIPWNNSTISEFEIKNVRDILNEDHTGIEHVKKRITQLI